MKKKHGLYSIGLLAALIVAGILSPFASSSPDGLERVGEDTGFIEWAKDNIITAIIPDYMFPGISHEGIATSLAGVIGVGLTFLLLYLIGKFLASKAKEKDETLI
ncbi:MAG: PDGLE domain-containing protein [Thermotaleaceae bacterium]